jgi:hypothetical protein
MLFLFDFATILSIFRYRYIFHYKIDPLPVRCPGLGYVALDDIHLLDHGIITGIVRIYTCHIVHLKVYSKICLVFICYRNFFLPSLLDRTKPASYLIDWSDLLFGSLGVVLRVSLRFSYKTVNEIKKRIDSD